MLENWLEPTTLNLDKCTKYQFLKCIKIFKKSFPNLKNTKTVLLGITAKEADDIRHQLFQLANPFDSLNLVDIGNLRKSNPDFVFPVIKELLDANILPIILGSMPDVVRVQYLAHKDQMDSLNMVVISNNLHFNKDLTDTSYYLNDIFTSKKPFHFGLIGYQRHFLSKEKFDFLNDNLFDFLGLGETRANIESTEPIIRDADLVIFDIDAIRFYDAPGQENPSPTGFSVDEICQLCRYAGLSDKLTSVGFYGYKSNLDQNKMTAKVMALMIWYTLDGLINRKLDFPVSTDGLVEYIVSIKSYNEQVTFWKSTKSGRWWIQFPIKTKKREIRHQLIPCTYEDYLTATQNELPDRLLQAYRRFG